MKQERSNFFFSEHTPALRDQAHFKKKDAAFIENNGDLQISIYPSAMILDHGSIYIPSIQSCWKAGDISQGGIMNKDSHSASLLQVIPLITANIFF